MPLITISFASSKRHPSKAGVGFVENDGLRWKPPKQGLDGAIEQLVLPQECHKEILELLHDVPFADHLGKEKIANKQDTSEILLAYSL